METPAARVEYRTLLVIANLNPIREKLGRRTQDWAESRPAGQGERRSCEIGRQAAEKWRIRTCNILLGMMLGVHGQWRINSLEMVYA